MQIILDISTLLAGFGLLVALIYAAYQFGEAKRSREATYLTNLLSGSPTELRMSMKRSYELINGNELEHKRLVELPEPLQEQILRPLYTFDGLGYLVAVGAVRLKSVAAYFGDEALLTAWRNYEHLVTEMREDVAPYVFSSFEDLASRIEAGRRRLPAKVKAV